MQPLWSARYNGCVFGDELAWSSREYRAVSSPSNSIRIDPMSDESPQQPDPITRLHHRAGIALFCYAPLIAFCTGQLPMLDICIFPILAVVAWKGLHVGFYVGLVLMSLNTLSALVSVYFNLVNFQRFDTSHILAATVSLVTISMVGGCLLRVRHLARESGG